MLDIVKHITVGDKSYPLAFTLNVMEAIQEKCGSLDEWSNLIDPEEYEDEEGNLKTPEPSFKIIKWSFAEFINEGIDIENEEKEEKREFVTTKQVGRIIASMGMVNVNMTMTDLMSTSVNTGEETGKNA